MTIGCLTNEAAGRSSSRGQKSGVRDPDGHGIAFYYAFTEGPGSIFLLRRDRQLSREEGWQQAD